MMNMLHDKKKHGRCLHCIRRSLFLLMAILAVGMIGTTAFADQSPRLSDVVVDSDRLKLGVGEQLVTISVVVIDEDADIDPASVKLKKVRIGKKNQTVAVFADDGQNGDAIANDRRFSTQLSFNTSSPRTRTFRIKAKDRMGNRGLPLSFTVSVGPSLGLSSTPIPTKLDLTLQRVFPELRFSDPVALLQSPNDDTRWFLVTRTGIIYTFLNQPAANELTPVLDLRQVVEPLSERDIELGMLALAFHPNFERNRQAYVYYTAQGDNGIESRLSRFDVSDQEGTFQPDTEEVLIRVEQPRFRHNGGQIAFGPDGFLYLSVGDGGERFESQNPESFLGKMLRIDLDGGVPYAIPSDNPVLTQGGPSEVFAMGLRNPWRWSFDPETEVAWLGDVGNRSWEEIDVLVAGANYGWPILEGEECAGFASCDDTSTLANPILSYSHDEGCSVIGGHVYHGTQIPELNGVYLFSDFCSGAIVGVSTDTAGKIIETVLVEGADVVAGEFNILPRSISVDQEGEIYVIDNNGRLYKLVNTEG